MFGFKRKKYTLHVLKGYTMESGGDVRVHLSIHACILLLHRTQWHALNKTIHAAKSTYHRTVLVYLHTIVKALLVICTACDKDRENIKIAYRTYHPDPPNAHLLFKPLKLPPAHFANHVSTNFSSRK